MSTTIDQRVVEMRFDNKQFEQNVSTTMSTLEKLKAKLNLTGASKGLENVSAAAKNFHMGGMASAVDTVTSRFSALDVMGVTALANLTNSAVNAGKKIVNALTIEPVSTGYKEYELKLDSIKTIMASTGESVETVNKYLEELNRYSDETIYSFSDMTQNIGKFTNAGVKLEDAVLAIKGISNEAAVSGANANEASRAMYNFAQALSAGYVKLIDWKSIELANMATKEFKTQLLESAVAAGTLTKGADGMYQTLGGKSLSATKDFNETLNEQWMTTEVLINTLKDYADETTEIGAKAKDAATKVRKFTQMIDVLKETAQSGWAKTWELIFGDIEVAESIFSPLTDFLSGIINKMSDFRNSILEGALSSPFGKLAEKVSAATSSTNELVEKVKDLSEISDKVMKGMFGHGQARWDKLTEAGYDWAAVQNLVNEKMGSSVRHTEQVVDAQEELQNAQATTIEQLVKMSDEELKNLNFTEDEIKAFRDLAEQAESTGKPISELVESMGQLSGREMLIQSFKNAGQGLVAVFTAVKNAWVNAFPPMTSEQLYNIIEAIHKFSERFIVAEETAEKLERVFKGLFAAIDIVTTITGGALKAGLKAVLKLFGQVNVPILDYAANLADAIVAVRDWIDANNIFAKGLEVIAPYIREAAEAVREWIEGIKGTDDIPGYIISGLANGLREGIRTVVEVIKELAIGVMTTFCELLGIASPSKKFFEYGGNIIDGLINGITEGISLVVNCVKKLASNISNIFAEIDWGGSFSVLDTIKTKVVQLFKDVDWGALLTVGITAGLFTTAFKVASAIESLAEPLEGFSRVMKSTSKVLNSVALSIKSRALMSLAKAIAILVGSIVVLTLLDEDKVTRALIVIGLLAGTLVALSAAVGKWGPKDSIELGKFSLALVGLSSSLLIIAASLKLVSSISETDLNRSVGAVAALSAFMIALIAATKLYNKDAVKVGSTLLAMSASMLLLIYVMKQVSELDSKEIKNGIIGIGLFSALFVGLIAATKLFGNDAAHVGTTLLKMSIAIGIMVAITKLAAGMSMGELIKGSVIVMAFGAMISLMIAIADYAGKKDITALNKCLFGMAAAMVAMALVIKLIGGMDAGELAKGVIAVGALAAFIGALMYVTKYVSGNDLKGVGLTLLSASLAVGILAAITVLLGLVKTENLVKGIIAVGLLTTMMSLMMWSMKGVTDIKWNLIVITGAIALLAAAVAALSQIDANKLAAASLSLSLVMGMFALITKMTSGVTSSIKSIATMVVAVGLIGGLLYLLGSLETEDSIATATAISILLLAISASLKILDSVHSISLSAMGALVVMTLITAALAGILSQISDLPVESTMANAVSLSLLLTALSASCLILAGVGALGPQAGLSGLIVLGGLIAGIYGILMTLGAINSEFPKCEEFLNKGIPILESIGLALGKFFGNIVGGFLEGALTSGLPGMGENLSKFMENASGFFEGVKDIDDDVVNGVKGLAETILLLTGANILESVSTFLTGSSSISKFAQELVPFGKAIADFSAATAGNIDAEAVEAAANAGKMLAKMAEAIPNSGGLAGIFAGENNLSTFATQLIPFGHAIAGFSGVVAGRIDKDAVDAATSAGMILAELASTIPKNGESVFGVFAGQHNLATFGEQLIPFGRAIAGFSGVVAGNVDMAAVEAAATAGNIMSELANSIPVNGESVFGLFAGQHDLATFGSQIVQFAIAITNFSAIVSTKIDATAVEAAATAGKLMAELATSIPNCWGLVHLFTGNQDLSVFGKELQYFGNGIVQFSAAVKGIDTSGIDASVSAARGLAELAKELPSSGGLWSVFSADNDMSTFGSELRSFGLSIKAYADTVSGIDDSAVRNSITSANRLVNLVKNLVGLDTSGVATFKNAIRELGKVNVKDIVEAFSAATTDLTNVGKNMISSIISGITAKQPELTSSISTLMSGMTTELAGKFDSFKMAGSNLLEAFIIGFEGKRDTTNRMVVEMLRAMHELIHHDLKIFTANGEAMIANLVTGMISVSTTVNSSMKSIVSTALAGVNLYYSDFYDAGEYLVKGFAAGISDNAYRAEAKARAMARAAAEAAEEELDINSPSKRFYGIGDFAGQGFVNALSDYAYKAYNAGTDMARSASDGLTKAISNVADLIGMEIDAQPTISPVLDLSNVKSGASAIAGMLGVGSSVGVLANVGTVGSMMRGYSQNGTNDDVVSAINKLRSDLGNIGGTSYNINGITYSEGTEVADAIGTLVRAAKMERRI